MEGETTHEPARYVLANARSASLVVTLGAMLALVAPASAGSMKAATATEIDDRPADMRAIYAIEDRAEAIAEGEKTGGVARAAAREPSRRSREWILAYANWAVRSTARVT